MAEDNGYLFNKSAADRIKRGIQKIEALKTSTVPDRHYYNQPVNGFFIKLTDINYNTSAYAWEEVYPDPDSAGSWIKVENGRTGSATVGPAYESSKFKYVPKDSYVYAWPAITEDYLIFAWHDYIVLGKTDSASTKGGSAITVSVWKGAGNSETDSGSNITDVYNRFADVASGKWVIVNTINGLRYLTAAEC